MNSRRVSTRKYYQSDELSARQITSPLAMDSLSNPDPSVRRSWSSKNRIMCQGLTRPTSSSRVLPQRNGSSSMQPPINQFTLQIETERIETSANYNDLCSSINKC